MSLFLDVSITAQSIVDAAWARATANRERLRRRLDVQAVREEAGRDAQRGWEQRYTTPTPLLYKADEPVAYPGRRVEVERVIKIGGVFYGLRDYAAGDTTYYLHAWSADGLATSVATIDLPPGEAELFQGQFAVFPINGTSCVLLWLGVSFSTDLSQSYNNQTSFFVGQSSARQITVPSWMANRASGSIDLLDGRISYGSAHMIVEDFQSPIVWTPQVYQVYTRVADELVYSFPPSYAATKSAVALIAPGLKPIAFRENTSDPDFAIAEPFGYEWSGVDPVLGDSGSIISFDPRIPFDQPEWALVQVSPPPNALNPVYTSFSPAATRHLFWDWGKPDYCRAQLLALGFQPEDLEP